MLIISVVLSYPRSIIINGAPSAAGTLSSTAFFTDVTTSTYDALCSTALTLMYSSPKPNDENKAVLLMSFTDWCPRSRQSNSSNCWDSHTTDRNKVTLQLNFVIAMVSERQQLAGSRGVPAWRQQYYVLWTDSFLLAITTLSSHNLNKRKQIKKGVT